MSINTKSYLTSPDEIKRVKIYFAFIYLIFMTARAIFNPFITVYMQEKGLSTQSIGNIMAINSFIIIASQPFWGMIADKFRSIKMTLAICLLLQGLFAFNYSLVSSFVLIAVVFCLNTFFSSPEGPLLDSWVIKSLKGTKEEKALGSLKLWGCLGYAAASIISGLIINRFSTTAVIPFYAIMLIGLAVIIHFIKLSGTPEKKLSLKEMQLGRIFKDYRFLIFLLFIFLMQLPHRAAYTFFPVLINKLGGAKSLVGYTSAIMFVSEAVIMFSTKKLLQKVKPVYLIIVSAAFFGLWQFLYSIVSQPQHVVLIALLDGPAYALFTIGTLYYIDYLAPKELRTTYQTITYAVYFGLSGIAGNVLGGWCIEKIGFDFMYIFGFSQIIIATLVFGIFICISNKTKSSNIYKMEG